MIQKTIIDSLKQENESILKTIDSLKIQHQIDKLTYKLDTQNTIASEVNLFYDSAWLKLLFVITILGIVVPLIVQYFQRKNFKELTIGLKEKFDSKLENFKIENEEKINSVIKNHKKKIKKIDKKNKKALLELDGNTFYLQGRSLYNEKSYYSAIGNFLRSALALKKCGRTDRIEPNLRFALMTLKKLDEDDFKKVNTEMLITSENKTFEECLSEIENEINSDSVIISIINDIRKFIKKKNSA